MKARRLSLTSSQRKCLRSLAHGLDPVVIVGKQGITESLIRAVDSALDARELIKLRFNEHKEEKGPLLDQIARQTACDIAGVVGHVAILYRQHKDPAKRKIEIDR